MTIADFGQHGRRPLRQLRAGLLLGLIGGVGTALWAQDGTPKAGPAPRLALDLSLGATHATNPNLDVSGGQAANHADLRFGLTYDTTTPGQEFRLSLNGLLRGGDSGVTGLRDPSAALSYSRNSANSALSLTLNWQESPVDLLEPLVLDDGTIQSGDLLARTGTATTRRGALSYEAGKTGPLGLSLKASRTERSYSQTTDPGVEGSTSQNLSAGLHLRGAAGGDLGLTLGQSEVAYDDATGTERHNRSAQLSYDLPLAAGTTLNTALGVTRAETQSAGAVTASSSGATGALGVIRDMANGTAGLRFELERDSLGPRQSLHVTRDLDLPTGKLAADLGYSARDGGAGALVGSLDWSQDLPQDNLSLGLSRQVALDGNDVDAVQTKLSAQWNHQLSAVSHVAVNYGLTQIDGIGSGAVEGVTRHSLTASYNRDLTADWQLQTGVTLRSLDRDSLGQATDSAVFLTISRRLVLLP